jgi:hypothetical protein
MPAAGRFATGMPSPRLEPRRRSSGSGAAGMLTLRLSASRRSAYRAAISPRSPLQSAARRPRRSAHGPSAGGRTRCSRGAGCRRWSPAGSAAGIRGTPLADQSRYAWAMSRTRRFRNPLETSGSAGGKSPAVGLSPVGPPPALSTMRVLASATMTGSPVTDDVGAERRLVEVPGSVLVGDHQELRNEQLAGRRRGFVHHLSP